MSKHSWASRPTAGAARAPTKAPRTAAKEAVEAPPPADLLAREDDKCPVCSKERWLNPNMKLFVSTCFHRACSECVQRIFGQGKATCPIPGCGRTLLKRAWTTQTFEDLTVEKEIGIRREMNRIFNKRETDFETPQEYDAYLEMVEDIIQNKIHDTDPEGTALRIQEYKTSNEESIKRNAQRAVEERRLATWQEQERLRNLNKRRQFYEDLHEKERKAAEAEKIAYLQSLVVKPVEKGKQGNGVPAPVAAVKSKPSNAGPAISFLPDAPFLPDDEPAVIPPWELQKKETEQPIEDRTWRTWQSEAPIYSYDLPPADLGQVRDPLWESMKMDRGWLGGGNRGEFLKERALCAAVEGLFLVPGA